METGCIPWEEETRALLYLENEKNNSPEPQQRQPCQDTGAPRALRGMEVAAKDAGA